MKQKNFSQVADTSEELNYEVEGYDSCGSAQVRCTEDCFGSCMWTCAN